MDSHLLLWRHAEAGIGIKDINRDLTDKGKLDGKKIAELLAKNYTNMSLFCSNAIRTINTSNYLVNILPKIKTYYFDKLYLATSDEMINIIYQNSINKKNILCVGHNPGIHQLALSLVKKSSIDLKFEKINHKYPTAALAVIKIKDGNWENLYNNQNELIDFITPKDLKY